jgi:hypothetical protein
MLTLTNGAVVGLPPSALAIPEGATTEQLQAGQVASGGEHVYWHDLVYSPRPILQTCG